MGTILEVGQLMRIHETVARACETIPVNDEQAPSRGSAAALEPAAPVLEPTALADPSAPRPQPRTRGQVDGGTAPASSLSLTQRLLAWVREFIQFGMVGATAYVVDAGLFNLLQHGPLGFLAGHPNTAQFIAAATATLYSWIANRLWTYRGRTWANATREAILFFFANACGIGISQFCLLFTHHILRVHLGRWPTTSPSTSSASPWVPRSASSSTTTWYSPGIRARRF